MRKCLLVRALGLGLLFCLLASPTRAEQSPLILAYLETGLKDLNASDRQVALHLLARELSSGSNLVIDIRSLNSMEELLNLAREGRVHYAIVNSYFYIKDQQRLATWLKNELWAIQRSDAPQEDYVIVANKQFNYRNIASLRGKCLSLHSDYVLMSSYLDTLLRKEAAQGGVTQFFKTVKNPRTVSQGVLDVYFNTCDVTIVPQYILDLVIELNPAISEKVIVVHHSGAHFIPALALVFKNALGADAEIVYNNLKTLTSHVRGQEILDLFKIQTIRQIQPESLDFMLNFFAVDRKNTR